MKKILLMNVLFKPNIGGIENSLSEIAEVLVKNNFSVDILCSNRNNNTDDMLCFYEKLANYNIYRYEYSFSKLSFIYNIINASKLIKKLSKENKYSYIISRSFFLVIVAYLTGIRNIKYIAPEVSFFSNKGESINSTLKTKIFSQCRSSLQTLAFVLAKEVFVFSDTMLEQVTKTTFGLAKPIKVEPGINLKRFNPPTQEDKIALRDEFNIPYDKKVILCLGRFSKIKQFDIAIDSMNYLKDDDYLLLFVGSGPERKGYEKIIKANNLQSKVKIFNSTSEPEKLYKLSDVFLMTSRYESFGQTILESYVSGLKVIAFSKASGVNTNIEKILFNCTDSYLVDQQSAINLAQTIHKAFDTKYSRLSTKRNQEISYLKRRYSWDKFISNIGISI